MTNRVLRWLELTGLYVVLPALVLVGVVPRTHRWILFAITLVVGLSVLARVQPTAAALGWRRPSRRLIVGLLVYVVAVGTGVTLYYGSATSPQAIRTLVVTLAYPLISAPAQEFFFRSYYYLRYSGLARPVTLAWLNGALFIYYHAIYDGWIMMAWSAAPGAFLLWLWLRNRDIVQVSLIHGAFGIAAFLLGIGHHFTRFLD